LSGNDNIHNEAHYVASTIRFFVLKLLLVLINMSPLIKLTTIRNLYFCNVYRDMLEMHLHHGLVRSKIWNS